MYRQIQLIVLVAFFSCCLAVDTRKETTCQTHKRNSGGQRALMQWNIQCDAEGNYMPLQCTQNTPRWCACYNKDAAITSPSRSTKSCECHLAKDLAEKNSITGCDVLKCDRSGKYEKKQCCDATRKCYCVDPVTGRRRTEPSSDRNIRCD